MEIYKEVRSRLTVYHSEVSGRVVGLTLIELVIVIFIISLATALTMPSFWRSKDDELKIETKKLSSTLCYVYDEAITKKRRYLFRFDIDNNRYGFEGENESRMHQIKMDEGLKEVITPSLGRVSSGEVMIEFGPLGPIEPIVVHLKEGETEYTISFNHLTGRVKTYEGFKL